MPISQFTPPSSVSAASSLKRHSQWLKLLGFSLVGLTGLLILADLGRSPLMGQDSVVTQLLSGLFIVPSGNNLLLLVWPTLGFVLLTQLIIYFSPSPNRWSRVMVIAIVSAFLLRYLVWRLAFSLNFSTVPNGVFSVLLMVSEGVAFAIVIIQFFLLPHSHDRQREADIYSQAVISKEYQPTVDILIPTHNEPAFILKRTIFGCQALEYEQKKIYILDDGDRPEIKKLCEQLNCHYIAYPENRHAKGGNLNFGLQQTQGELVTVFDADFVPTRNFLTRTVGFFQQENLALVQTPQTFYNADPIATNLGLAQRLPSEEEPFYRQIQPMKDGARSVLCAGTSFVMRRSALDSIGGFDTQSLSEDYFTGIRLSAQGYDLAYLNEKLSAGLAAESISAHLMQRLRWGQGTLQAFFIEANPLTIPGLNWRQRLAHLEGLLNWFGVLPRIFFLMIPPLYAVFGIVPLQVTVSQLLYFFLPYYCLQLVTFHWLNYRSRSIFLSELYALVSFFPVSITVVQTLFNPFGKKFQVTPKGLLRQRYRYDYQLALPVLIFLLMTLACIYGILINYQSQVNFNWFVIWAIFNSLFLASALNAFLDVPKRDIYTWLSVRKPATLIFPHGLVAGEVIKISEKGAEFLLNTDITPDMSCELVFEDNGLTLPSRITQKRSQGKSTLLKLEFLSLTLEQERALIEFLFCQPGTWKHPISPGELQSLGLILQSLFRPLALLLKSRRQQNL